MLPGFILKVDVFHPKHEIDISGKIKICGTGWCRMGLCEMYTSKTTYSAILILEPPIDEIRIHECDYWEWWRQPPHRSNAMYRQWRCQTKSFCCCLQRFCSCNSKHSIRFRRNLDVYCIALRNCLRFASIEKYRRGWRWVLHISWKGSGPWIGRLGVLLCGRIGQFGNGCVFGE